MRRGQRFTPVRLRRWLESGRGTGFGANYQPWHQVTRADPGSRGRSHLINGRLSRQHHLLSDGEEEAFGFATMLPGLSDLREQHPLSTEDRIGDDVAVACLAGSPWIEGTLSIASALGLKHPTVHKAGDCEPWRFSTDLVLHLDTPSGSSEVIAVSVKQSDELKRQRTLELLQIEREYWARQGVTWILLTEQLYSKDVGLSIRAGLSWTLGQPQALAAHLNLCAALAPAFDGRTLGDVLTLIEQRCVVSQEAAQAIFWQSVWRGDTPINLAMSVRPGATFEMLSATSFWQQNPIAARRSAWTL